MSLPEEKLYYPIGNTPPADVTLGCNVAKQCDILLLGGGDIRNILFTVHSLRESGTLPARGRQLHFHLNDDEEGILSRDLVLLHVINTIDPSQSDDLKFLWCVWYDLLLSKGHQDRLMAIIGNLTQDKSRDEGVFFGNESTETAVKKCLTSWRTEERGSQEVIESRRLSISRREDETSVKTPYTDSIASRLVCNHLPFTDERNRDRYHQEVQEYAEVGTTRINTSRMSKRQVLEAYLPNVTFLPPASKNWRVPIDSSPFMCFELEQEMERYDGSSYTVARICFEKLTEWVRSFRQVMKNASIKVTLWLDDARHLCEETLPVDLTFDFIDTSTLADSLGLVSLLVHCRDRLKGESGVLRMEVFDWHLCLGEGVKYLRLCIDVPPLMYPTVLGLHLAEELEIGHERYLEMGCFEGIDKLVLLWTKAGPFTPCSLTGKDSISLAIEMLKTLTNPKRATDFPRVKSSHCDEMSQEKALARLKEVTTDNVKNQEKKVVEYNDRYEFEIQTEQDGDCRLSVTHGDNVKRLVNFKLSTGREIKFISKLRFSCPVLIDNNTWRKKGLIKGTLMKDKDNSVGERLLPWRRLTPKMISNMPDYPASEYHMKLLNIHTGWVYPTGDGSNAVDTDKPYPHHQLRDLCKVLMLDPKIFKDKMYCVLRQRPKGVSPLDKYQSTILLDRLKIFEGKPTMFLTLYDHDIGKTLLEDTHMSFMELMRDFVEIQNTEEFNEILLEGYNILKLILKVNSCRLQQDDANGQWKMKSFLRMRYPFKFGRAFALETDIQTKFTESGKWKSQHAKFEYVQMVEELSRKVPQAYRRETLASVLAADEFFKPVCDGCGRMRDCKKCTACNKVYYCSRSCQKTAWPQHKVQCRK